MTNTTKGYFNPCAIDSIGLTSGTNQQTFALNAPEGKDQLAVLVFIAQPGSTSKITVSGVNGFPDRTVQLSNTDIHAFRIPSMGYVNGEGKVSLTFICDKGTVSAYAVSVALTNHIDAVSN